MSAGGQNSPLVALRHLSLDFTLAGRLYQFVKPSGAGRPVDSGSSSKYQFGMLITPPPKWARRRSKRRNSAANSTVQRPVTQPYKLNRSRNSSVRMENGRWQPQSPVWEYSEGIGPIRGSTYTVKKRLIRFYIARYQERFPRSGPESSISAHCQPE